MAAIVLVLLSMMAWMVTWHGRSPAPTPTPIRVGPEDAGRMAREHIDPPAAVPGALPPRGEDYARLIRETAWVDAWSVLFPADGPSRRIEEPTGRLLWKLCRDGRIYTAVVDTTVVLCARLFFEASGLSAEMISTPDGGGFFAAVLPEGRRMTLSLPEDTLPWVELDRYGRSQVGFISAVGTAIPQYDARCLRRVDGSLRELAGIRPGGDADRALRALEGMQGMAREFFESARFVQLETPGEADGSGRVVWEDAACVRLSWVGPGRVAWVMVGQIHRGNLRASEPFDPRRVFPTRQPFRMGRDDRLETSAPASAISPPYEEGGDGAEAGSPVRRSVSRGGAPWVAVPMTIFLFVVFAIGLSSAIRMSGGKGEGA